MMERGWNMKGRRLFAVWLAVVCVTMTLAGWIRPLAVYGETGNPIVEDGFASNMSGQAGVVQGNQKLTAGKLRHIYVRIDLSSVELLKGDRAILRLMRNKNSSNTNTIVVTECEEVLRDGSNVPWDGTNLTYQNRPEDITGTSAVTVENVSGNLEVDVADFLLKAKASGKTRVSLHITTPNVDSNSDSAVDFDSLESSNPPSLSIVSEGDQVQSYVSDDTYVQYEKEAQKAQNFGSKEAVTIGKFRFAYIRLDISSIDQEIETAVLRITKQKGGDNTFVVYECENVLGDSSGAVWNQGNVTWNNRPADRGTEPLVEKKVSGSGLDIDVTTLIREAKAKGEDSVSLRITTTQVDNASVSATDFYSLESGNPPYLELTTKETENAGTVTVAKAENGYWDQGFVAQKIFKMKDANGNYLKLVDDEGSFARTVDGSEAAVFGLYVFDYDAYEDENWAKTSYAIKCMDNGKFLSIQNYFAEEDENREYYNDRSYGMEIQAEAERPNWNERFTVTHYEESDTYGISSHLKTMRDSGADAVPVRMGAQLYSTGSNRNVYKFTFEEVKGQDPLEVMQEVDGKDVILSWYPVDGDKNPAHYQAEGGEILTDGTKMSVVVSGLSKGENFVTVAYTGENPREETVAVRIFNHPGAAHSGEELEAMREHILKKEEPWYSDYQKLLTMVPDGMADTSFSVKARVGVGRGDPAGHGNIGDFEQSGNAAYFNALQWVITGDTAYADKAVSILNDWADTLKIVDGRDRILGAAINSCRFINAAEILRYFEGGYEGYADGDFKKFQDMMENVIYPVIEDLGAPMIANGNWDTAGMISMISIGVVCDNAEIYDRAVSLYQDIHVNGSIGAYVSDWGQSVESARDQAHAQLGIGYMADVCQVDYHQGGDLFGLYDNRLARAFNWAAQYNLYDDNETITFEPLMNVFGDSKRGYWTSLDSEKINRGELRPVYEVPLAYYSKAGVDVTWMEAAASAMRAQGYVHNDNLNFGTMTSYQGEASEVCQPYFQIRTRLEPWYQRTWNDAKKYGDVSDGIPETLTSYFAVSEEGEVTASATKASAPFFRLVNNQDGTYSLQSVPTGLYLSVKEETVGEEQVMKVDSEDIGDREKFVLKCTGAAFYYLESPAFDNRIVYVHVEDGDQPKEAVLTMRLGTRVTDKSADISNNEKLILIYNTEDKAKAGRPEEMDSLELKKLPVKSIYTLGEELNLSGMQVVAIGKDGSRWALDDNDYQVSGFDPETLGEQEITLSYVDGSGQTLTVSFTIKMTEIHFYTKEIQVTKKPDKLVYQQGDDFEADGLEVTAQQKGTPGNASRKEPLAPEVLEYEYDFDKAGDREVTVIYREEDEKGEEQTFTASIKVKVEEVADPNDEEYYTEQIKVTEKPRKLQYQIGEDFDPTGMEVTAYQKATSNNAQRKVKLDPEQLDYEYDFSRAGSRTVKIFFQALDKNQESKVFTASLTVQVKEVNHGNTGGSGDDDDDGSGPVSGGVKTPGTEYRDPVKGVMNTALGIITGNGEGYSSWVREEGEPVRWKLRYADGTMAQGAWFVDSDGQTREQIAWEMVDGQWFAFGADSYAKSGFVMDYALGGLFYIDIDKGMVTGWQFIHGKWYYFNMVSDGKKGILLTAATTPDGYRVGDDGVWIP